ncbi:hypothetical protein L486_05221 [Kwoniella mangroviensis CBS 10435]|uniref:Protein CPL1-like domain-containing protein n=1 Tax=Kwoniella mangroviensis CBS 10435 TaxID=1331196 RepID=A0A1B9IQC4_9TREE|nr:hypothetical protein L486_05221 [Kwoniella mangroviensis CBS 10435]
MLFPTLLLALPLLSSASLAFSVSNEDRNSTLTSRHNGGGGGPSSNSKGSYQTCARVAGTYGHYKYDFGCICQDDVEQYCRDNGIHWNLQNAMQSYISQYGKSSYYPSNAQPTCDGRGGYTCGSLYKKSDGSCSSSGCSSDHWSPNGSCCPRGQTYSNGRCCGSTGCSSKGGQCTPIYTCPQGQEFKTTQCCKTYLSEMNGQCACPSGYEDDGSKCSPKCKSNEKIDSKSGKCVTVCDENNGFTYQKCKSSDHSLCCSRGQTAYDTVCCSKGQEEIDKSGICCTEGVGAKVQNGKCIEPTSKPKPQRRSGIPVQLTLKEDIVPYGMEQNRNGELCPPRMAACPIEGRFTIYTLDQVVKEGEYECVNPLEDLQSCGGCSSLGTGKDCSAIPGARWMGCNKGQCQVYSCKKGWKTNGDGTACEKLM